MGCYKNREASKGCEESHRIGDSSDEINIDPYCVTIKQRKMMSTVVSCLEDQLKDDKKQQGNKTIEAWMDTLCYFRDANTEWIKKDDGQQIRKWVANPYNSFVRSVTNTLKHLKRKDQSQYNTLVAQLKEQG